MTANNTTNNVVFFFVSDLKIVYNNNFKSSITMSWIRRKNILRHSLFGNKIIQNVASKISQEFNNYPQKSPIYCWVLKFQATVSVNNIYKKAENPRCGRKLTARCPNNMDAVRNSVRRSPKKSPRRRSQELGLSHALLEKVNKFLLFSSGLTFLKGYDCFLTLR